MARINDALKSLCTKSEWRLVEDCRPGCIESFTLARIKTKVSASERLREKWADLARKQKKESNDPTAAARSMKKARLFADVFGVFVKRQRALERKALQEKAAKNRKALKSHGGAKKNPRVPTSGAPSRENQKKKKVGIPASIRGHISSRNKRDQAKRDSR